MKRAAELLDDLLRDVEPPPGCAIALRECESATSVDPNWVAFAGVMPEPVLLRLTAAITAMRRKHPVIDWYGVTEKDGDWRRIAKSRSAPTSNS
jgi:hypothetical protein